MRTTLKVAAAYAAISAVYLLYLPHAVPVTDEWGFLQVYQEARDGGLPGIVGFLRRLIDNRWIGVYRTFWLSFVPAFLLSFGAGFTAWPYFLLGWMAHWLTGVMLWRIILLLIADTGLAFAAGAIYVVFPAANGILFWPLPPYYWQPLVFAAWFSHNWQKLAVQHDFGYGWRDAFLLLPTLFSGEQILPALALLLPTAAWLLGPRNQRGAILRFVAKHLAVAAVLLGAYTWLVNRVPVVFGLRPHTPASGSGSWRPGLALSYLLASVGLKPEVTQKSLEWRPDFPLAVSVGLGLVASVWGLARLGGGCGNRAQTGRLLLWAAAGVFLTYLPVAHSITFEFRYLYVPALFLVPAGVSALRLMGRRTALVFMIALVALGITANYFEMSQCWAPQSRTARGILEAVKTAAPVEPGTTFIFSGAPVVLGTPPAFITFDQWAIDNMLAHYAHAPRVQAGRELVLNERNDLAVDQPEALRRFPRENLRRLRVFVREAHHRFAPRSLLAWPTLDGQFWLVPLGSSYAGPPLPSQPLTMEELKALPFFGEVYFLRRLNGHRLAPSL